MVDRQLPIRVGLLTDSADPALPIQHLPVCSCRYEVLALSLAPCLSTAVNPAVTLQVSRRRVYCPALNTYPWGLHRPLLTGVGANHIAALDAAAFLVGFVLGPNEVFPAGEALTGSTEVALSATGFPHTLLAAVLAVRVALGMTELVPANRTRFDQKRTLFRPQSGIPSSGVLYHGEGYNAIRATRPYERSLQWRQRDQRHIQP